MPSTTIPDLEGNADAAFKAFVDRVAHVCDARRGGPTVSAVAIIQEFEGSHYFVGSNQRTVKEQENLGGFLRTLLALPRTGVIEDASRNSVASAILFMVVDHNLLRIKFYSGRLVDAITACMDELQAATTQTPRGKSTLLD